ncbi:glycosyltransferase [Oceanobacillus rekensis]|uniref:glycosyltransferase n=1 Tax=Oceanobacillus rekensis TaxID=937927 RepID=UPI00111CC3DE|nr:glycosyltransferase [Oceanobacillus rekensis]
MECSFGFLGGIVVSACCQNKIDIDYIIRHTSIIHFCGKKKPWHKNYTGKFHALIALY